MSIGPSRRAALPRPGCACVPGLRESGSLPAYATTPAYDVSYVLLAYRHCTLGAKPKRPLLKCTDTIGTIAGNHENGPDRVTGSNRGHQPHATMRAKPTVKA